MSDEKNKPQNEAEEMAARINEAECKLNSLDPKARLKTLIKGLNIQLEADMTAEKEVLKRVLNNYDYMARPSIIWEALQEIEEEKRGRTIENDKYYPYSVEGGNLVINPRLAAKWLQNRLNIATKKGDTRNRVYWSDTYKRWLDTADIKSELYYEAENNSYLTGDLTKSLDKAIEHLELLVARTRKLEKETSDFSQMKPINYIIEGLISTGTTSLFYGKSGHGKTSSIILMCKAIKAGRTVFEQKTKSDIKIAYMSFEQTLNEYYQAFQALEIDPDNLPFELLRYKGGAFTADEIIGAIKEDAAEADLVVLDNLYSFSDASPYSTEEIVNYIGTLTSYAEESDKHIIICHHSSKMNYGSGANKATADNASGSAQLMNKFSTAFEARREGNEFYTEITKLRDWSGLLGVCYDFKAEKRINPHQLSNAKKIKEAAEKTEQLIEELEQIDLEDLTCKEVQEIIADKLGYKSTDTIARKISKLGYQVEKLEGNKKRYVKAD